ncbi:hypothetical protein BD560DRAFT_423962 [Blakeslea trispora]|nr:hypothetical protein BD560DRAFT_423962 [Blakeslea trispora]
MAFCGSQNTQEMYQDKKPYIHPHDPFVEEEYEALIRAWKNQLVEHTPSSHNNDYIRFAWMRLMDHYLDQQWLDSKQMLQCAQAWSARDALSLTEAVHTMNILSLKLMQRSLDARQEMLQALGDPGFMVSFGIPSATNSNDRVSLAGTEDEEEEEEDQEIHAPLFSNHEPIPANRIEDEGIVTCHFGEPKQELLKDEQLQKPKQDPETMQARRLTLLVEQSKDMLPVRRRSRVLSFNSTPALSSNQKQKAFKLNRKYESFYHELHHDTLPNWKEDLIIKQPDISSESTSAFTSAHSEMSSPILQSEAQWKSWFLGDDAQPPPPVPISLTSSPPPSANNTAIPVPALPSIAPSTISGNELTREQSKSTVYAEEKVETDVSTLTAYPRSSLKKIQQRPSLLIKSESSITAFRPISNNLAPRCQPLPSPLLMNDVVMPQVSASASLIQNGKTKITKSKSFPSKSALLSSKKFGSFSPPPPMPPQREQSHQQLSHFMTRVKKKVSLTKLFTGKKSSSSTSSSSNSSDAR